jgi:predicted secreted protein
VTNVLASSTDKETTSQLEVPQIIKQFNHVTVQAKTVGKFAQSTFDRVQLYPTQTGAKQSAVEDPTTKKHKKGKKNVKVRSGWTKDYDY